MTLDESASRAFYARGTPSLTLNDCGIHVNSSDGQAMRVQGNANIDVTGGTIDINGGYSSAGPVTVSPSPNQGAGQLADPFADMVPAPSDLYNYDTGSCDFTNTQVNSSATLSPGVYCGGIQAAGNGTLTFQSGDYVTSSRTVPSASPET